MITEALFDFKQSEKIKGLSFALFDSSNVISQVCLGKSTYRYPIDEHTLFSIQSISKNVTALAVMFAVQDSLVKLDVPISEYLPDFTVNSCFEIEPQKKITLELLLSHTAGFTHEAPVGGNFDFIPCTYQEHVSSIAETWLKFPVGTQYAYSNLGIDLAAHIVEVRSGMAFNSYLKNKLFDPLGMPSTTVDDQDVVNSKNKTEGDIRFVQDQHLKIPLQGAGGTYTCVDDFTKYVQFLMCLGNSENTTLDEGLIQEMFKIRKNNYGLGTYIGIDNGNYFVNHNGGGYGYGSSMIWMVEYNLGAILLCNKPVDAYATNSYIINEFIRVTQCKKDRSRSRILREINRPYFENYQAHNKVNQIFCTDDTLFSDDWNKYLGTYAIIFDGINPTWLAKLAFTLGYRPQKVTVYQEDQALKFSSFEGIKTLRKFEDGVFFTQDGEMVDFSASPPSYRNIKMEKLR